jgi:hypothetical protein
MVRRAAASAVPDRIGRSPGHGPDVHHPGTEDPVSNVLEWTLLAGAVLTFALLAWATGVTYQTAPPQPNRFVASNGAVLITGDDILAGKAA